jgi:hypothetical protein
MEFAAVLGKRRRTPNIGLNIKRRSPPPTLANTFMGEKSFWANMAIGFLLSQTMGSKGPRKKREVVIL